MEPFPVLLWKQVQCNLLYKATLYCVVKNR